MKTLKINLLMGLTIVSFIMLSSFNNPRVIKNNACVCSMTLMQNRGDGNCSYAMTCYANRQLQCGSTTEAMWAPCSRAKQTFEAYCAGNCSSYSWR